MNHSAARPWWVVVTVLSIVSLSQPAQAAVPDDFSGSNQGYLGASGTKTYESTGDADTLETGNYNGTEPVVIAIIGNGLVAAHPDLDAKVLLRTDLATVLPDDPKSVTQLAGIAAAVTNNGAGSIAGVCRDCKILSLKADMTNAVSIRDALVSAVNQIKSQHGASPGNAQGVILLAYDQGLVPDEALTNLLRDIYHQTGVAVDTSITVVAPAGSGEIITNPIADVNDVPLRYPSDEPSYPCAAKYVTATEYDESVIPPQLVELSAEKLVLCTGAVDTAAESRGQRSVFSSYGDWVDVYAPGQGVYATLPGLPGNLYGPIDDTGAAAAIAAGVAARIHAITAGTIHNTPAEIREIVLNSSVVPAVNGDLIDPSGDTTFPGVLNDLTATRAAQDIITVAAPAAETPSVLAKFFDTFFGIQDAWAADPPPAVADLRSPGDNFLVVPAHKAKGRDRLDVRGRAVGTYTIDLLRHDCTMFGDCSGTRSYNPLGTVVQVLRSNSTAVNITNPNTLLLKVCPDRVVTGANCAAAGIVGVKGTNDWPEGEYSIRLTVKRGVAPAISTAISTKRIFVDRSTDASFNEDGLTGVGAPELLNDVVLHGPNLADLGGAVLDGKPEIVVASAQQRRVYVFDALGNVVFKSAPMQGRIVGTPAVGDVDGDGYKEIVVTADVTGQPSLYVWDADTRESGTLAFRQDTPKLSRNIGPSKASPALGRRLPTDLMDDIFVTTTDNRLRWYSFVSGTGACKGDARLTDTGSTSNQPAPQPAGSECPSLTRPVNICPSGTSGYCGRGLSLMESKPLIASLNSNTPRRVYVPSQDPFSTYGFEPKPDTTPFLRVLPGFPFPWPSAPTMAPGGSFDMLLAHNDNDGDLELYNVRYIRGASASADRSRVVILEVQGATFGMTESQARKEQKSTTLDWAESTDLAELFMYSGAATDDIIPTVPGYETALVGMTGKVYLFDKDATVFGLNTGVQCPANIGLPDPNPSTPLNENLYAGWPKQMGGRGSGIPLIADVDSDGQKEILTVSNDQLLYAWDTNGCLKRTLNGGRYGFPRSLKSSPCFQPMPLESPMRQWTRENIIRCTSPAIGNLDGDTNMELVVVAASGNTATNAIYMWELGSATLPPLGALPRGWNLMETAFAEVIQTHPSVDSGNVCRDDPGCAGDAEHAEIKGQVKHGTTVLTNATVTVEWPIPGESTTASFTLPSGTPAWDSTNTYHFTQVAPAPGLNVTVRASVPGYPDPPAQTVQLTTKGPYSVSFNVNRLPTITFLMGWSPVNPPFSMQEAIDLQFSPLTFEVVATDPDGDNIQISGQSLPPLMTFNGTSWPNVTNSGPSPMTVTIAWDFRTLSNLFGSLGNCTTYSFTPVFNVWDAGTGISGPGSFASRSATINLVKVAANHPPIVRASVQGDTNQGLSSSSVGPGRTIYLYGSGSCDPDGNALSYAWAFLGSSPTGFSAFPVSPSSRNTTATAPSNVTVNTTLTFGLTVSDGAISRSASASIIDKLGCWIATAAFGSPVAPGLDVLRTYRDTVLARSALGQRLVALYYQTSPPVARFIADKPVLRALVRAALRPLIAFARKQLEEQRPKP